jgi:hypothetical protein
MPEETAIASVQFKEKSKTPVILKTKTNLPKPKQTTFSGERGAHKFFEYWKSFNEEQQGCAEAKVYRKYPVIDQCLIGGKHKERIDHIQGKIPFEPEEFESHFLHNYGSGSYMVMLDEIGVPGVVASCTFRIESQEYPPRVDIKTLVAGHPDNRGFIAGLTARGVKLPWETNVEEEEASDMKVAAIDMMARQTERVTDKLLEVVGEQRENQRPDPVNAANAQAIGVIAKAGETAVDMVSRQADRLAAAAAPSFNPVELIKTAMEITKPTGDGGLGLATLVSQIHTSNQQVMQQMHHETLEAMRSQQNQVQVPAASELDSFLGQIEKIERLKNVMGWGGHAEPREAPQSKGIVASLLENPKVAESIPVIAQAALLIVQNLFGPKGTPAPAPNPAPNPAPGNAVQATPQQQPRPMSAEEQQQAEITLQFLKDIERPFISHYFGEAGLNGYTFAHAIQAGIMDPQLTPVQIRDLVAIRGFSAAGQQNYQAILSWGPQKLDVLIKSYGPIWNTIQGTGPKKYAEFLTQFFNYDKWIAEQAKQGSGAPVASDSVKPN